MPIQAQSALNTENHILKPDIQNISSKMLIPLSESCHLSDKRLINEVLALAISPVHLHLAQQSQTSS